MVNIISVSVDNKQAGWLQTHKGRKDCSPTFLLRQAVHTKMQEMGEEYIEDIRTMRKKVERVMDMQQNLRSFIERKGLIDEFLAEEE